MKASLTLSQDLEKIKYARANYNSYILFNFVAVFNI